MCSAGREIVGRLGFEPRDSSGQSEMWLDSGDILEARLVGGEGVDCESQG